MAHMINLDDRVSVAGALTADDIAAAAKSGFRTIVNLRPDGEAPSQTNSDDAREAALEHGLRYVFIPATRQDVFSDRVVSAAHTAFGDADAPILAHCAAGQRAAIVWAATEARRGRGVDDILAALKSSGFNLPSIRDDLEGQAYRNAWSEAAN